MKSVILFLALGIVQMHGDTLDKITAKVKDLGRQTPINIELYAKNPSQVCALEIKNITNPYKKDITKSKLKPITLQPGRYFRADISDILRGRYEFEYKWNKNGKFVDSSLETVHIFVYHDTRSLLNKKLNLTFLMRAPKGCR